MDEPEPTKSFLSTLPATMSGRELINTTKLRWRIEREVARRYRLRRARPRPVALTTRTSRRNSALVIMSGEDCAAFTIMPRCASLPTHS